MKKNSYMLNGNMTSLTRKGVLRTVKLTSTVWVSGEIDHLSMTYDGNRLQKATDQCAELTYAGAMDFKDGVDRTEEYTYDANGNMTQDRNKDIYNITYNVLNLPECIEYYNGHEVRYTYAADRRKLHVDYVLNPYAIADEGGEGEAPDPSGPEGPAGMAGALPGGEGLQAFDGDPIEIEEPDEPLEPQVLMTRDWCGSHIYRNGALERVENSYGYWADSCYHYRIADYQGNIRAVISQNGVLEEVNGYYPYGGLLGAPATGVQARKYGGKELDRENGLDWYDSQARMYDPLISRTTTQDPLAEKYYNLSPYLWCAGNPIRFIDNDGKKLRFASGVSQQFKNDFALAVKYLHENNCDGLIAKLENRPEIIYIAEFTGNSFFRKSTHTIFWNPTGGLITGLGVVLSPTTVLNHEADHALQELVNHQQKALDEITDDIQYDNLEEKRVIQGSEQRTAKALGEIKEGEVTRTDHSATEHPTLGPTTTELNETKYYPTLLPGVVVTPKVIDEKELKNK